MEPHEAPRNAMKKFISRYNKECSAIDLENLSNDEMHEFLKSYYVRKKQEREKEKEKKKNKLNCCAKKIQDFYRNHFRVRRNAVVGIQKCYRSHLVRKILGPGFRNLKNVYNEEDFCMCIPIDEIKARYFYSYKSDKNIYVVDTRSFNTLLEKGYNEMYGVELNPEIIRVHRLRKLVFSDAVNDSIPKPKLTPTQERNNRIIKLFHEFDKYQYTDMRWLKDLSYLQLRELYQQCHEMWIYHFKASKQEKARICPKTKGIMFVRRDIYNCINYNKLIDTLVNEMYTLVTGSEYEEDRKQAVWLMLTALCRVSYEANCNLMLHVT